MCDVINTPMTTGICVSVLCYLGFSEPSSLESLNFRCPEIKMFGDSWLCIVLDHVHWKEYPSL